MMITSPINKLFAKPIDRPIDGVIKADDERHLQIELEEYVFTREVIKGINNFIDAYLYNPTANGVWISGFFGSGKSHLLKILSLILDKEKQIGEKRTYEILLPKIEDELLKADLKKAISIPSKSILFNIDQKYDGIGGNVDSPVLEVFMKVLNEVEGYYGKQGYIAELEHDLDKRNEFISFKKTYEDINKNSWESDRDAVATITKRKFAKAFASHFGGSEDDGIKVLNDAKDNYKLSIEGFAERVKEYLNKKGPYFRINFFVDEVGQFIGQDRKRLLNLQTVVESLATVTDGRASVFITSQSDLEGVLGQVKVEQADDISKIQGRFKTKLSLASADVQEVIQKRLLEKKPFEPEELIDIYEKEHENFTTLYRFGDNSIQLKGWTDCQSFCGLYPFHPYQLSLFQQAIQSLASHSIFEGRNMAVGERSMLSVFQDVAKSIKNLPIGTLASFDQLYDGISEVIRSDKKQTITTAQNQLGEIELRVLKALFLLKWVSQFKCTSRNISILLINQPNFNINKHLQNINDALLNLHQQSYLQKNGEIFEFLTDKEKDIEQEIKRVEINYSEIIKELYNLIFEDILGNNGKVRFEENNYYYPIAFKIDDALIKGKENYISANLITPENSNYQNNEILIARNMGGAELMVILPDQNELIDQIRTFLKTDSFIRRNSGSDDDIYESILASRSRQNSNRRKEIRIIGNEMLQKSKLIINGQLLNLAEGEPKTRFGKAYQDLIRSSFPKLTMIKGFYDEESFCKVIEDQDSLIVDSDIQLSEAENEIMREIFRRKDDGVRISVEFLTKKFELRPYGWSRWATITFIARLYKLNKIELREKELLSDNEVFESLNDFKRHSGVTIRKQDIYDPKQIKELKLFHQEFFGTSNNGHDARSSCNELRSAIEKELKDINEIASLDNSYPFLSSLKPWITRANEILQKNNNYLLKELNTYKSEWLEYEESLLTPIKLFMKGQQKLIYDEVKEFLRKFNDDINIFPKEETQSIITLFKSTKPYEGGLIPKAKSTMALLDKKLEILLSKAKENAEIEINKVKSKIQKNSEFANLSSDQKEAILEINYQAKNDVLNADRPGAIFLRMQRYRNEEKPRQLQEIATLSRAKFSEDITPEPITVVPSSELKTNCDLSQITNDIELEKWLDSLRTAAQKELNDGNRISL